MEIRASSADQLYYQVIDGLIASGSKASPRGERTLEVIGAHFTLTQPDRNIITLPKRKLSYPFMVAEFAWMMMGSNSLSLIQPYNNRIALYSDNGETLNGAYGPKLIEQLPFIIDILRAEPSSRQAVLTIWRERPRVSKDIPCTVMMQFFVRELNAVTKYLDMVVYMRSNDVWWGLPYDLFNFTMIQQHVAASLGILLGQYHHMVGSMHMYERNMAEAIQLTSRPLSAIKVQEKDSLVYGNQPAEPMPDFFKTMFVGLTLMAKHAESTDEMKEWAKDIGQLPDPWDGMMSVLAHRFHKDDSLLMSPWRELIAAQAAV